MSSDSYLFIVRLPALIPRRLGESKDESKSDVDVSVSRSSTSSRRGDETNAIIVWREGKGARPVNETEIRKLLKRKGFGKRVLIIPTDPPLETAAATSKAHCLHLTFESPSQAKDAAEFLRTKGLVPKLNAQHEFESIRRGLVRYVQDKLGIQTVFVTSNESDNSFALQFVVDGGADKTEEVTQHLTGHGIGHAFGSMTVVSLAKHVESETIPACISAEKLSEVTKELRAKHVEDEELFEEEEEDESVVLDINVLHAEIANQIRQGAELSLDFILLVTIASILAGIALAANNTVVVVASMLVSPLMGPILASVFGFVVRDWEMVFYALLTELYALLICIASGFIVGLAFSPWGDTLEWPNEEMKSRGTINGLLIGLGIAIPSGVGVALGVLGSNQTGLVGVAISASLLPPAVNCGLMWAYGAVGSYLVNPTTHGRFKPSIDSAEFLRLGGISFSLTLLNIGCILIFAYITFKLKIHLTYPGKPVLYDLLKDVIDDGNQDEDEEGTGGGGDIEMETKGSRKTEDDFTSSKRSKKYLRSIKKIKRHVEQGTVTANMFLDPKLATASRDVRSKVRGRTIRRATKDVTQNLANLNKLLAARGVFNATASQAQTPRGTLRSPRNTLRRRRMSQNQRRSLRSLFSSKRSQPKGSRLDALHEKKSRADASDAKKDS